MMYWPMTMKYLPTSLQGAQSPVLFSMMGFYETSLAPHSGFPFQPWRFSLLEAARASNHGKAGPIRICPYQPETASRKTAFTIDLVRLEENHPHGKSHFHPARLQFTDALRGGMQKFPRGRFLASALARYSASDDASFLSGQCHSAGVQGRTHSACRCDQGPVLHAGNWNVLSLE